MGSEARGAMSEAQGRPNPDDRPTSERQSRPGSTPARPLPEVRPEAAPTRSASGEAPPTPDAEATVGLERTASAAAESSGSAPQADPGDPAPAARPPAPKEGQLIANRFVVHRLLEALASVSGVHWFARTRRHKRRLPQPLGARPSSIERLFRIGERAPVVA